MQHNLLVLFLDDQLLISQKICCFHLVLGIYFHPPYTYRAFLLLGHACGLKTQEHTFFRLQDDTLPLGLFQHPYHQEALPLIEFSCRSRPLGDIKFCSIDLLEHTGTADKQQLPAQQAGQAIDVDNPLLTAVIIAYIVKRRPFVPELSIGEV